jgi:hypothetical protein
LEEGERFEKIEVWKVAVGFSFDVDALLCMLLLLLLLLPLLPKL